MQIEVDFEVFKALTALRRDEGDGFNDVLRRMMKLPENPAAAPSASAEWTWKGVRLPDGTQLRTEYKGREYRAEIRNAQWLQNEKTFSSPSAAAFDITQYSINGWTFWMVRRPTDGEWRNLSALRS